MKSALSIVCVLLFFAVFGCGDLGEKYPKTTEIIKTGFSDVEYAQLDKLYSTYLKEGGRIDYAAWRKNAQDVSALRDLFIKIAFADVKEWKPEDKKAFYINAHNVVTFWLVLWRYSATTSGTNVAKLRSIQNLAKKGQSVFNTFETKVGRELLSPQSIREKILAPMGDARVHLALYSAAKSSPPIPKIAFRGDTVDSLLDRLAKDFVNGSAATESQTYIDASKKKIVTSQILNWYRKDFEKSFGSLENFFNKYAPKSVAGYEVEFREFDWALNEPAEREKEISPKPGEEEESFWKRLANKFKNIVRFIKCDLIGRVFKVCDKTIVDPTTDPAATESILSEGPEQGIKDEQHEEEQEFLDTND